MLVRRFVLRCLAAALPLALLVAALPAPAAAGSEIFQLLDPRGDDHGDGRLVYPLSSDFQRGDLDLLSLTASHEGDETVFEAVFARPVRQPGRQVIDDLGTLLKNVARHGFYTLNIDIYIDEDRQPGSGGVAMLPGRKAEVDPAYAWERAVVLTPRPDEARAELRRILMSSLRKELKSGESRVTRQQVEQIQGVLPSELESRIYFPNRVRVRGTTVRFSVPDAFLGGAADPGWAYVVAVSGADVVQSFDLGKALGVGQGTSERLMILPIGFGTWENRFGGAPEDDDLVPPLVDIIVPPGTRQETLLRDHDPEAGRPVRLPGVVPRDVTGP